MQYMRKSIPGCAVVLLVGGCGLHDPAAGPGAAAQPAAPWVALVSPLAAAMADDAKWPPAGCPDADGIRAYLNDPAMQDRMAFMGIYSGDDTVTDSGNRFWLGTAHGVNVQSPNAPLQIPQATAAGQGWLLRWNTNDKVIVDGKQASETVSAHYVWDYSAARDGAYAVNALAINRCTGKGNGLSCEQPLFGKAAWQADASASDPIEICPPVILPEDPSSLYAYDLNQNPQMETYEYSLALVLTTRDSMNGLRLIIDPRVQNGGLENR